MSEQNRTPRILRPSLNRARSIFKTPTYTLMLLFLSLSLVSIPITSHSLPSEIPRLLDYEVVREFPHDPEAYTQGLAYDRGTVYEGTGLYGKSSLRQIDLSTGRVERRYKHEKEIFGEGITVFHDRIYQLSWQNNLIFAFRKDDFSLHRTWPFDKEGWGVTHDGEHLIVSDGSSLLYFLEPTTMEENHVIEVYDHTGPVQMLNELEFVKGRIYANIYRQDRIAIINPEDGAVTAYLDLSRLVTQVRNNKKTGVLNGVMHDPDNDRLFVTGKLWPSIFEIKIVPLVSN
ncbi:MAG: glutaminyl-peptide cyclotransferase [Desulfobulbaceae bacterium]|nr:MAG: glutaminyl-peptide cyclotransferase [Desulfobulbaceae bacterium]